MCGKCNGTGWVVDYVDNGPKLVHACECKKALTPIKESDILVEKES